MSSYRERMDQAERMASERPCPFCGHEKGAHRGYPVSDCVADGCKCAVRPGKDKWDNARGTE